MSTEKKLQHIVIVGGGFAGFLLAKRINPEKFRVTLVDRIFMPFLLCFIK